MLYFAFFLFEIAFDSFESKKYRDPEVLYPYIKGQITDEDMYYYSIG